MKKLMEKALKRTMGSKKENGKKGLGRIGALTESTNTTQSSRSQTTGRQKRQTCPAGKSGKDR